MVGKHPNMRYFTSPNIECAVRDELVDPAGNTSRDRLEKWLKIFGMEEKMKIAIVNDVHVGKPLTYESKLRAASHMAAESLPIVLNHIIKQHDPDVIINLGDLIRADHRELDKQNYASALAHFKQISRPVIHLLGNHELKHMNINDIDEIWRKLGLKQTLYGHLEMGGFALVWLGLELNPQNHKQRFLPAEQLAWLRETLKKCDLPVILFTHCALDDQKMMGNFFYELSDNELKEGFFLENASDILQVISQSSSVEIVMQAHLHYFYSKTIEGTPYLTCPAMGDNICGPNAHDHFPEIYTLLTLTDEQITVKAYSRQFSFAGTEFQRKRK